MSIEAVKEYLSQWGRDKDVLEFPVSSATVELAAEALHTAPEQIAKTLSFVNGEGCFWSWPPETPGSITRNSRRLSA